MLKGYEVRRQHVLRQGLPEDLAQLAGLRCRLCGARVVGHDALVSWFVLAHDHDAGSHRGVASEGDLDLPELDAMPAHLDLVVRAPEELDHAVGAVARPVAGAVHAGRPAPRGTSRGEGVGDEALGRQLRAVEVAAHHAVPADVELARHPDGHRLEPGVEDVQTRVGDRASDRNRLLGAAQ